MKSPDDFAERLKTALKKAGRGRDDLIAATGLTRQAVNKWLAGESGLRMEQLFTVADLLQVEPRWLATGVGSMHLGNSSGCTHSDIPERRISLLRLYATLSDDDRNAARRFIETMAWFANPRKDSLLEGMARASITPKSNPSGVKANSPKGPSHKTNQ